MECEGEKETQVIALDTNILLRVITADDEGQLAAVKRFLERESGPFFLSHIVLIEAVWTLQRAFGFSREEIVTVLQSLADRNDMVFEDGDQIQSAIRDMASGGDFADSLIALKALEFACDKLLSFDLRLASRQPEFVIVPE